MPIDGTLLAGLQARRNIPVRYNRELVARTLEAMTRIEQIRSRRERRFYAERMKGNRARQLEADRKLVRENQHLLPVEERERAEGIVVDMEDVENGEEEEEEGLEESEMQGVVEEEAMRREEEVEKAIREEEKSGKVQTGPKTKGKGKGRKAVVGERMDVDG